MSGQVINEEIKDLLGGKGGGGGAGAGVVGEAADAGGGDGSSGVHGGLPLRENAQGDVTVAGLSKHEVNQCVAMEGNMRRGDGHVAWHFVLG